jgi:hypothetical protein
MVQLDSTSGSNVTFTTQTTTFSHTANVLVILIRQSNGGGGSLDNTPTENGVNMTLLGTGRANTMDVWCLVVSGAETSITVDSGVSAGYHPCNIVFSLTGFNSTTPTTGAQGTSSGTQSLSITGNTNQDWILSMATANGDNYGSNITYSDGPGQTRINYVATNTTAGENTFYQATVASYIVGSSATVTETASHGTYFGMVGVAVVNAAAAPTRLGSPVKNVMIEDDSGVMIL